jgi:hypothetical protein
MVPVVAVMAVVLLLVVLLLWRTRRQLKSVSVKAAGSVEDLTDVFHDLNDLRISLIDHLSSPQKPLRTGPVTMPVVVAAPTTDELTAWADGLMGQQEPPDPEPHTVMIPRVPATRHNPSEPKTTTISVAEIAARLKAEQSEEAAE